MNIIKRLKRNPCEKCIYFIEKTNACQSKKCACNTPYISKFDRMFCKPRSKDKGRV